MAFAERPLSSLCRMDFEGGGDGEWSEQTKAVEWHTVVLTGDRCREGDEVGVALDAGEHQPHLCSQYCGDTVLANILLFLVRGQHLYRLQEPSSIHGVWKFVKKGRVSRQSGGATPPP